jgi:hypothetical protein
MAQEPLRFLEQCESYGQRCGGPVLLVGAVLGSGVVQLVSGPLGQTSRFSLELLILLMLKLTGPLLVAILAMALLLPHWLTVERPSAPVATVRIVLAAALVGALLQLMLLVAALCGGLLASPRADLVGEWRDLLGGLRLGDVVRSMARAALFLASICGWMIWRTGAGHASMRHRELLTSNLLVEGLMVLMGLKLAWIMVVEPLRLSASPQ